MTEHVTHPSISERMERARKVFETRARENGGDRVLYQALTDLATSHEDLRRSMEYLKVRLEEVRQAVGHHLETSGAVPHTRRRGS